MLTVENQIVNQGSMFLDSYFRGDQLSPIPFVHRSRPWQFPTIEGLDTILTNLDTLTVRATGAARCARFLPAAKLGGSMDGSPLRDHFRSFLGKCTVSGPPIRSRSKRQLPPFPPLTLPKPWPPPVSLGLSGRRGSYHV